MNGAESGRETAERSPVFVDASGRRRRGVTVLGYLGASACTAYLAAFGITVSTHAGVIDATGVALAPTPSLEDEGDDPADAPEGAVVPATASESHTVTDAAVTTPAASRKSASSGSRHQPTAGGRHAAAEPRATAAPRGVSSPRVPLRVVRSPHSGSGHATAPASSPRPTSPHGGSVPGTPHSTPGTTPSTGGGTGGGSSSGGAGPTTGSGTTGGGTTGGGTTGGGTTGNGTTGSTGTGAGSTGTGTGTSTGTGSSGSTVTDPLLDVGLGPVAISTGV
jgi:hypothetical protein